MFMCVLSSFLAPKAFRRVSLFKGFPFWILLGFYQASIIMPGHDHSIVPKLKPGDLGTQDAFFLWNCPIQDEGLSIRQHVIE